MNQPPVIFPILAATFLAAVIVGFIIFGTSRIRRFLDVSRGHAFLIFILSLIAGFLTGLLRYLPLESAVRRSEYVAGFGRVPAWTPILTILASGLLVAVAIPFVDKLYLKWIGGRLTDAEKAPGVEGVRAWLRGGNLFVAALLALCAWLGFGYSFWSVLALTLMALMIYPLMNMTATTAPKSTEPTLSQERERVLKMLDEGKITAAESAELLNALAVSQPPRTPQTQGLTSQRKMVLAGLGILLIGFFLPWFSYNPGQEMNRVVTEMQGRVGNIPFESPFASLKTGSVSIAGGDIRYGLGWLVLLVGIAIATLPYVAGNLSQRDRFRVTIAGLAMGAIVLIYLLTQNMRFVSVGILLALAGYALQLMGTLKEKELSHA